jgi:hypothetical protein
MRKEPEYKNERRNRAKCALCEDVIESKSRHDFVSCSCGAIFVDGGRDYCRMGGNMENIILLNNDGTETSLLEVNQTERADELFSKLDEEELIDTNPTVEQRLDRIEQTLIKMQSKLEEWDKR